MKFFKASRFTVRYYATELFSGIQQENGWRFHELRLFPSFYIYYYVGAEIHRSTSDKIFSTILSAIAIQPMERIRSLGT